jgi:Ala-tRNA(Pro) deacylase
MPISKLKAFLDAERIQYVVISHSPAFTAQQIAASAHVKGRELAKTVMVQIDGRLAMAVLPASQKVDLERLREAASAEQVKLASEREFRDRFPDCDLGAMPPFGNLYGLEVYVADGLTDDEEIAFNAGSFTELVRMSYHDFERLVQPKVLRFAVGV